MHQIILNAVSGDHVGLRDFTDVDSEVSSFEEGAHDFYVKIKEYQQLYDTRFIEIDGGYIFYITKPKVLVSFFLHVDKRTRRGLDNLWKAMVDNIGEEFICILWAKNTRAIKWLKSRGMVEFGEMDYNGNKLIKLCL